MIALQELPSADKDLLLPYFQLRPWVGARRLQSALDRLHDAYGDRPCFLGISEPEGIEIPREVHRELDELRNPENGFDAWCSFLEQEENARFIPTLLLTRLAEFDAQAQRLFALGRGLFVHIERSAFPAIRQIVARTAAATEGGRDVVFMLDFGRQTHTLLLQEAATAGYIREIQELAPQAFVAVSASSFPELFTSIQRQNIYERRLFDDLRRQGIQRLIYSDRGSARAERQTGGGGAPAPRVDYPARTEWLFFRSDGEEGRRSAYATQAQAVIDSGVFDARMRVWGVQMIERTAVEDGEAIVSPARSTAARINIHLHQQLFYDNPGGLYDTDEDWSDDL